jgi:hypothetical protein
MSEDFRRGFSKGLQRARNDAQRLAELATEGRGAAEWLPGLDVIVGWLGKLIEHHEGLLTPSTGPDTPAVEPSKTPAPGDSP